MVQGACAACAVVTIADEIDLKIGTFGTSMEEPFAERSLTMFKRRSLGLLQQILATM